MFVALASSGLAQSFNIDLQPQRSLHGAPGDNYGAASGQTGRWQPVTSAGATQLRDVTNTLSAARIELPDPALFTQVTGQDAARGDGAIFKDACNPAALAYTVRLSGLIPGRYGVFTYAAGASLLTGQEVTVDGVTHFVSGTYGGGLEQGRNYTVHAASVAESGELDVHLQIFSLGSFINLNALQVVRINEVGTLLCQGDGTGPLPCPCGNDSPTPTEGCTTSTGAGMRIWGTGSDSITADDLVLSATGLPPENIGLFFVGQQNLWPGQHLFDGIQCAGGNVLRFQPIFQTSGVVSLRGFVGLDPTGMFFDTAVVYVFQYFSRDAARGGSPCGGFANLTPGLRVVFGP